MKLLLLNAIKKSLIRVIEASIAGYIAFLIPLVGGFLIYYFGTIQHFFVNHPILGSILFISGWTFTFYEACLLIKYTSKFLVNGILVDGCGDCFCPHCEKLLYVAQNPKMPRLPIFHCAKCKLNISPQLENGMAFSAIHFANHQKYKLLTTYTKKHFQKDNPDVVGPRLTKIFNTYS